MVCILGALHDLLSHISSRQSQFLFQVCAIWPILRGFEIFYLILTMFIVLYRTPVYIEKMENKVYPFYGCIFYECRIIEINLNDFLAQLLKTFFLSTRRLKRDMSV